VLTATVYKTKTSSRDEIANVNCLRRHPTPHYKVQQTYAKITAQK